jgi:PAS domain S-box-containing protein
MIAPSQKRLRLLHLEDNIRDAKLCRTQLERAGFKVHADVVSTPDEFLNALRSDRYDMVLADYRLPGWSGLDALESLKKEGQEIPFILVTGTVGEQVAVECIKKGATDYILKDRLARLSVAVERALEEVSSVQMRRKAEQNRDLLASIVETSDDAIIGVALDGTILSWNRGAGRMYKYEAEEIQGRTLPVLFAPETLDRLREALITVVQGQNVEQYETRGKTRDGAFLEVAVTLSPIRDPAGVLTGASAIMRDITEQKCLQREFFAAQKMEAIGRLAAGVAHDFNNLLTVVTGYCGMLLAPLKEHDPLHEEISEINKAAERAASLTRQLLAFSRKQVLRPRVLDLNSIVAEMDRMLRRLIGEDVDLVTVLDPHLGSVSADPGQIEQVIMNLAVNSRDAMPQGGKLIIETANMDLAEAVTRRHMKIAPGSYVTLAVTDTGTGMDAETQARVFDPFFTTKAQGEGTGLGLSTVYGIVTQSGGTVQLYSEPGHGSTFKVHLPRVQKAHAHADAPCSVAPSGGSEKILVVEDEDAVRSLICSILQRQGYTVLRAKNGGEALLACERHSGTIDLMITDVIMPSMSGDDLAARLNTVRPEMKVIFMSGYTDSAIVHHGVLANGTAFLEKPFTPQAVARKVREVLDVPNG